MAGAALTGGPPRADLTYVNPSGVHTLDPARMSWTQDFRVALNLWEGLSTWDPRTLEPIPAAAHAPEISDDGLVLTFSIRDDARWSNGDRVTAQDFVRGWRRAMEPGTAADYLFFFTEHIAGAGQYVDWRNKHVAALTGLRKLARGTKPSDNERRLIEEFALARDGRNSVAWLDAPQHDWGKLADELLIRHAAEAETRFAEVGVAALDDRTLGLRLTHPCTYLADLTASPVMLPIHESIERLRMREGDLPFTAEGLVVFDPQWTKPSYSRHGYDGLITNGPYRLSDWVFRQRLRMEVNPHNRAAGSIQCRSVEMLKFANVSASLMAYEAGVVDFLTDLSVPYGHELARLARAATSTDPDRHSSDGRADFRICTVLATYFLNFNCVRAEVNGRPNPFTDARVRRAFTLATDRAALVERVLARGDRIAGSMVPPDSIPGYTPPMGLPFDVDKARALLAEAGYDDPAALGPIEILGTFNDERLVQAVARMWREVLGVRVEIRTQETKTLAKDKIDANFLVARGNWYADYNDPTTFLNCQTTGDGNNDTGYSNREYDALLSAAKSETDPARRARLLREAESILVERDCPVLPILHYAQIIAAKPYVRGLHANARLWFPFQYVSIDR